MLNRSLSRLRPPVIISRYVHGATARDVEKNVTLVGGTAPTEFLRRALSRATSLRALIAVTRQYVSSVYSEDDLLRYVAIRAADLHADPAEDAATLTVLARALSHSIHPSNDLAFASPSTISCILRLANAHLRTPHTKDALTAIVAAVDAYIAAPSTNGPDAEPRAASLPIPFLCATAASLAALSPATFPASATAAAITAAAASGALATLSAGATVDLARAWARAAMPASAVWDTIAARTVHHVTTSASLPAPSLAALVRAVGSAAARHAVAVDTAAARVLSAKLAERVAHEFDQTHVWPPARVAHLLGGMVAISPTTPHSDVAAISAPLYALIIPFVPGAAVAAQDTPVAALTAATAAAIVRGWASAGYVPLPLAATVVAEGMRAAVAAPLPQAVAMVRAAARVVGATDAARELAPRVDHHVAAIHRRVAAAVEDSVATISAAAPADASAAAAALAATVANAVRLLHATTVLAACAAVPPLSSGTDPSGAAATVGALERAVAAETVRASLPAPLVATVGSLRGWLAAPPMLQHGATDAVIVGGVDGAAEGDTAAGAPAVALSAVMKAASDAGVGPLTVVNGPADGAASGAAPTFAFGVPVVKAPNGRIIVIAPPQDAVVVATLTNGTKRAVIGPSMAARRGVVAGDAGGVLVLPPDANAVEWFKKVFGGAADAN